MFDKKRIESWQRKRKQWIKVNKYPSLNIEQNSSELNKVSEIDNHCVWWHSWATILQCLLLHPFCLWTGLKQPPIFLSGPRLSEQISKHSTRSAGQVCWTPTVLQSHAFQLWKLTHNYQNMYWCPHLIIFGFWSNQRGIPTIGTLWNRASCMLSNPPWVRNTFVFWWPRISCWGAQSTVNTFGGSSSQISLEFIFQMTGILISSKALRKTFNLAFGILLGLTVPPKET